MMRLSQWQNTTIRFQIACLIGVGGCAFLLIFLLAEHAIQQGLDALQNQSAVENPRMAALYQINIEFMGVRDAFSTALNDNDADALDDGYRHAAVLRDHLMVAAGGAAGADHGALLKTYDTYVAAAGQLAHGSQAHTIDTGQLYAGITRAKAAEEDFRRQLADVQAKNTAALAAKLQQTYRTGRTAQITGGVLAVITVVLLGLLGARVVRHILHGLDSAVDVAETITQGNLDGPIRNLPATTELGRLLAAIGAMRSTLKARLHQDQLQDLRLRQLAAVNTCLRGELTVSQLCSNILGCLVPLLDCQVGIFYIYQPEADLLVLAGHYAGAGYSNHQTMTLGESLLGQAGKMRQPIILNQVPSGYMGIHTGVVDITPQAIVIFPVLRNDVLLGVIELGSAQAVPETVLDLLNASRESIALAMAAALSREQLLQALAASENT
jgi:HAMP domain-containing protein/putative methionine-R-sulfoxide reductase with GAF domain